MNRVILLGILTKDPETVELGMCVTELAVAGRSAAENTRYFTVVCRGKEAETVAANCRKGSHLLVDGSLNVREYFTELDGVKHRDCEVAAEKVYPLETGRSPRLTGEAGRPPSAKRYPPPSGGEEKSYTQSPGEADSKGKPDPDAPGEVKSGALLEDFIKRAENEPGPPERVSEKEVNEAADPPGDVVNDTYTVYSVPGDGDAVALAYEKFDGINYETGEQPFPWAADAD